MTKTDRFTGEQNRVAEVAKVLGHPARIAILQYLCRQQSCVCGSIVEEVGLAQATVSQHLKALKDAELIVGTVEGVSTCYCLNTEKLEEAKKDLSTLLDACCGPLSCC